MVLKGPAGGADRAVEKWACAQSAKPTNLKNPKEVGRGLVSQNLCLTASPKWRQQLKPWGFCPMHRSGARFQKGPELLLGMPGFFLEICSGNFCKLQTGPRKGEQALRGLQHLHTKRCGHQFSRKAKPKLLRQPMVWAHPSFPRLLRAEGRKPEVAHLGVPRPTCGCSSSISPVSLVLRLCPSNVLTARLPAADRSKSSSFKKSRVWRGHFLWHLLSVS